MNKHLLPLGAGLLLALLVTGCETDGGRTARVQEKSTAYATLKPWEKKYVDRGDISVGFTPDMVYMALGSASNVKHDAAAGNGDAELWTYNNFYLPMDANHIRYGPYRTEAPYQPATTIGSPFTRESDYDGEESTISGGDTGKPIGMARGLTQSIAVTGGPQGGSMEPADLQSYTLYVLFVEGKVAKFGVKAN